MKFYRIGNKTIPKKETVYAYPEFLMNNDDDLMVRGKNFYAIWDENSKMWSMDEHVLRKIIDADLAQYCKENGENYVPLYLENTSNNMWYNYRRFINNHPDNYHILNQKIIFSNQEVKKEDYASYTLPYPLTEGATDSYDELVSVLYSPEELMKIEWAIGGCLAGDATRIQKFIVLYGKGGTGKGTILEIVQALFHGYCGSFNAKMLSSSSNQFPFEPFKTNPVVAVQTDGNLSKIEDNTNLNQIIAHEVVMMNEKGRPSYSMRINTFLFMASNNPVQITDAKSGLIRRLIDVNPTGNRIEDFEHYNKLMSKILNFELSGIAWKCIKLYKSMGPGYYNSYRPQQMLYKTNHFFNFVEEKYFIFLDSEGITVKQAYEMYKDYCANNGIEHPMRSYEFRSEIQNYFDNFDEVKWIDGKAVRSWLSGFRKQEFNFEMDKQTIENDIPDWLNLKAQPSLFDQYYATIPAQKATKDGKPCTKWDDVKDTLKDINTHEVHFCKPPINDDGYSSFIAIDFDFKNEKGEKDPEINIREASKWTKTYAELSRNGGLHLYYIWTGGDTHNLSPIYSEHIEVKTFNGGSSLRRKLTKCNDIPIATLSSGLPLKGDRDRKVVNSENIKNEEHLRNRIRKALNKEYPPGNTSSNIDYIFNDLETCYNNGMCYDVTDLLEPIISFAANATNQSSYCLDVVTKMHFHGKNEIEPRNDISDPDGKRAKAFLDVEVYPNLFIVVWKYAGDEHNCVRMINPTAQDIEVLLMSNIDFIGFNSNRYDKYMIYAAKMGYSNQSIFELSQRIIKDKTFKPFPGFYNELSNIFFTDVYDYMNGDDKISLKRWELKLDIPHKEMDLDWDKPVPKEFWDKVAQYCENDVRATEAVFNATQTDFHAREMLATLSKILTGVGNVGMTTNQLTERIILRGDKNANKQFIYPDLAKEFPGYEFNPYGFPKEDYIEEIDSKSKVYKSKYLGRFPSEGGRVFSKPGAYFPRVVTFDVASMHPTTIKVVNAFGKYTKNLSELTDIRLHIKHKEYDKVAKYYDGALVPYLGNPEDAKALSYALKIAINSVYGLTAAKFPNAFRDERNIDNFVAKRGALMMIKLQTELENRGVLVIHVKTDSIKVVDPDEKTMNFIFEFGKSYGYTFEIESVYERICLVNKSTYIARCHPTEHPDPEERGKWTGTGEQFSKKSNPYVFKTLFSKEPIIFDDLCEIKNVKTGKIYLDMNEDDPSTHNYVFVGKTGRFCPMLPGVGAGEMKCRDDDNHERYTNVQGTTGYLWMESDMVKSLHLEDKIDMNYFRNLAEQAINDISAFSEFDWFVDPEMKYET